LENYQFLKDLFQACMMQGVEFLGIAMRNRYANKNHSELTCRFFATLYVSRRITLRLRGILVIGY